MDSEKSEKKKFSLKFNLKNMGIGVFMFFLIKGLVWLGVIFGMFKFAGC